MPSTDSSSRKPPSRASVYRLSPKISENCCLRRSDDRIGKIGRRPPASLPRAPRRVQRVIDTPAGSTVLPPPGALPPTQGVDQPIDVLGLLPALARGISHRWRQRLASALGRLRFRVEDLAGARPL